MVEKSLCFKKRPTLRPFSKGFWRHNEPPERPRDPNGGDGDAKKTADESQVRPEAGLGEAARNQSGAKLSPREPIRMPRRGHEEPMGGQGVAK